MFILAVSGIRFLSSLVSRDYSYVLGTIVPGLLGFAAVSGGVAAMRKSVRANSVSGLTKRWLQLYR